MNTHLDLVMDALGFDYYSMNTVRSGNGKYPPHDIWSEKIKDIDYTQIDFALSGWDKEDIIVTLSKNILTVKGINPKKTKEINYHTIGISKKSFTWEKVINEHVIIESVEFVNGILSIRCYLELPEEQKLKTFSIK
jgi:HSP20 family molecular chaperone IbpA